MSGRTTVRSSRFEQPHPITILRQVLKGTTFLTNMLTVVNSFENKLCDGTHQHARVSGNEGGQTRSSYSSIYPADLVSALVEAMLGHTQPRH